MESILRIQDEYVRHLLEEGVRPASIHKFCSEIDLAEDEFFESFNSFDAVEKSVWVRFHQTVMDALENDSEYEGYTTHEKFLSYLYTLVEVLKQNRSYVLMKFDGLGIKDFSPEFLKDYRESFKIWAQSELSGAMETEEVMKRPLISDHYHEAFWVQCRYVIHVWTKDTSEEYQTTDAAIEKTSALVFESLKKGPIDLLVDFVKFAYQNKAY